MGDDLGQTDFRTSEIRISKDLNDNQKLASFIHEAIHCVNTQLTEEQVDYPALDSFFFTAALQHNGLCQGLTLISVAVFRANFRLLGRPFTVLPS